MTPENKELLLRDLSARLPYNVKCNVWYGPKSPALNEKDKYTDDILETIGPKKGSCTFHNAIGYDFGVFPVEHVKPYLRPMSSMTEEECKYCVEHFGIQSTLLIGGQKGMIMPMEASPMFIDWLNKKMFAYRTIDGKDMFELGIALRAPEGMYKV